MTEPIARAGKLAGTAAALVFAAGAAGAVLLGDWQVAKLGLIAAMVTYVLASLVAITVRNLSGSAPVANSARAFSRWRRRERARNWRRNIP
ncbi:MAG: hypothetical protein QOD96_4708 [Pseudonocardiales bacterium]|nr:hypothetical protein [Pseudonocardiales bacterium]